METLLNEKEAAAFLGIDEPRLKELVTDKVVPAYMIAGQFMRFKKTELNSIREILGKKGSGDDERVLTKAFSKVTGLERIKEIIRANDVYIVIGICVFIILMFIVFKAG
ncbi:MAG: hypothetical protein PHO42_00035 [Candidatus Omnitrophica bacterium]|nr:hypothetical protein [Candidatus Omnitrophota bacterium]